MTIRTKIAVIAQDSQLSLAMKLLRTFRILIKVPTIDTFLIPSRMPDGDLAKIAANIPEDNGEDYVIARRFQTDQPSMLPAGMDLCD